MHHCIKSRPYGLRCQMKKKMSTMLETGKATSVEKVNDNEKIIENDNGERFTFFWGYKSPLSNFHFSTFRCDRVKFNSVQQMLEYEKANYFGDVERKEQVMKCTLPFEQRKIGLGVLNFDQDRWVDIEQGVMSDTLAAKFSQNQKFWKHLLNTGKTTLAKATSCNVNWSIRVGHENDALIGDPNNWRGDNRLGKVLMKVRDQLATPSTLIGDEQRKKRGGKEEEEEGEKQKKKKKMMMKKIE